MFGALKKPSERCCPTIIIQTAVCEFDGMKWRRSGGIPSHRGAATRRGGAARMLMMILIGMVSVYSTAPKRPTATEEGDKYNNAIARRAGSIARARVGPGVVTSQSDIATPLKGTGVSLTETHLGLRCPSWGEHGR